MHEAHPYLVRSPDEPKSENKSSAHELIPKHLEPMDEDYHNEERDL